MWNQTKARNVIYVIKGFAKDLIRYIDITKIDDVFTLIYQYLLSKQVNIMRINSTMLTSKLFKEYQNKNIPIIISNLHMWNNDNSNNKGIDMLNDYISPTHQFNGIFVSKTSDHRFTYFKHDNSSDQSKDMYFTSMKWESFYKALKSQNNSNKTLYLYGQPIPNNIYQHITIPSFLSLNVSNPTVYLWISNSFTCSSLHYDLNDGLLYQLHGNKKLTLISPQYYHNLYPCNTSSIYSRQSQIKNINSFNQLKYPLSGDIISHTGTLHPNEALYIPMGWWHQIEGYSPNNNNNGIISLSISWNVFKHEMTNYLKEFINTFNTVYNISGDYIKAKNEAQTTFDDIIKTSDLPERIKIIANYWKDTCVKLPSP